MSVYLEQNKRRGGLTTAMCDLAIMNALAGQHVQFWCAKQSRVEHVFRTCTDRLYDTGLVDFFEPPRYPFMFLMTRQRSNDGRIEFASSEHRHGHAQVMGAVEVVDGDEHGVIHIPDAARKR